MATLTRAEQGTCPTTTPNSPRHRGHGRGWMDRNTPAHPSSHTCQTGLGQSTSAHSSSAASRVATASQSRGGTQALTGALGNAQNTKDSNALQCFRCQGWGHMARECTTLAKPLNQDGGNQGNVVNPHQLQSINLQHSLPDPKLKLTLMKAARRKGWQQVAPIPFLNPYPIAHLVGHSNEVPMIIDGQEVTALINLSAQVLSISAQCCKELTLQIQPLGQLLELEGMGGAAIPYLRFVEVNLQMLRIRKYNEDVLLLIIPTMIYFKMVPVVVGTKIIDKAPSLMTAGELAKATMTWWQAHFGAVMLGLMQLFHNSSDKSEMTKGATSSSQKSDPVELQRFQLNDVKGLVCTTQKVTILPFGTVNVWANTSVRGHCMWVHVLMEQALGPKLPAAVISTATYGELHPGSSRVPVCLHNLSAHAMEVPAKTIIGQIVPANQVPPVVHPTRTAVETKYPAQKGWVLEALDLQGLNEWPESEQKQARELLLKWEHLFAHSDLDLGKTALIKHKIQLTDQMPFKECYRCMPPHMYDDVRAHIHEMLDISAIHQSHSLWASKVVLVQKKDGGLRFCIDLRKLNNPTVKDVYLLPQIDKSLDSLQGSQWFSSLDLKSGYWQVKMDEESKPLTAFTVGPLGLYECKRMPFWAHQHLCNILETNVDLFRGPQSPLVHHLSGWHSHLQTSG